jgi:hypothetical protein
MLELDPYPDPDSMNPDPKHWRDFTCLAAGFAASTTGLKVELLTTLL